MLSLDLILLLCHCMEISFQSRTFSSASCLNFGCLAYCLYALTNSESPCSDLRLQSPCKYVMPLIFVLFGGTSAESLCDDVVSVLTVLCEKLQAVIKWVISVYNLNLLPGDWEFHWYLWLYCHSSEIMEYNCD